MTETVKSMSDGLPAARKAAGIDYSAAERFVSRLSTLGDKMRQLEIKLMTFDDKELAQKVEQSLNSQSSAGMGLDRSVCANQISSIKSQTKGLNEMTKSDDRFTWLYLLCGGVALMFGLIWMTLQKASVSPLP